MKKSESSTENGPTGQPDSRSFSAVFVAVGTELTSGELVNSNAALISSRLEDLGLSVQAHLTVPDDHRLILETLQWAEREARFIFVSGGLGPTKDDFTRELIAEWSGQELVRDEASVQELREKFRGWNRPFHAFQEQQCDFPSGAKIILNQAGTAHAFRVDKDQSYLWALPGPPREIESVWPEISEQLEELVVEKKSQELHSWLCFGQGESTIAAITEEVVAGRAFSTGYRAHAPYVEVKIWGEPAEFEATNDLQELSAKLSSYLMNRQRKTYSRQFLEKWPREFHLIDGMSRGEWSKDFALAMKTVETPPRSYQLVTLQKEQSFDRDGFVNYVERSSQVAGFDATFAVLPGSEENEFWVGAWFGEERLVDKQVFPADLKISQRIRSLWAMEKACALWLNFSTSS